MQAEISPVPREARAFQGERAGLVTRSVANTVDVIAVSAGLVVSYIGFNAALFMLNPRDFQFTSASLVLSLTTALVALVLYLTVAWSITGRTYGDHVMGLRVVGRRGGRVRFITALAR